MNRGRRRIASLLAGLVLATALLAAPAGATGVPVLVVDGLGFGHGVGMAQDGAFWMGKAGRGLDDILGHFYPGVGTGRAGGNVRVAVLDAADREAVLTFPDGGEVRSPLQGPQAPGFPVAVPPGGSVRVRADGALSVEPVGAVSARAVGPAQAVQLPGQPSPSPPTTPPPSEGPDPGPSPAPAPSPTPAPRPAPAPTTPPTTAPSPTRTTTARLWAVPAGGGSIGLPERRAVYRGVVEAMPGGAGLRLVNELDVEQYLRGMGEVRDPSWPAASLQAQAVVARTYALRAMAANGEICDTQRCQVYLGRQAEYRAMDAAVQATAGRVLTYRGGFASAVYSANGGGMSATPAEGFGTPDAAHPYLRAAPYETKDPSPWQVRIALPDLAPRVGYTGTIAGVEVASAGPSGRPTSVRIVGDQGQLVVPAIRFQRALGLRSTRWRTSLETAAVAPAPPPEGDVLQVRPEIRAAGAARRVEVPLATRPARDSGLPAVPIVAAAVLVAVAAGAALRTARP